jgi:hypothetical protein
MSGVAAPFATVKVPPDAIVICPPASTVISSAVILCPLGMVTVSVFKIVIALALEVGVNVAAIQFPLLKLSHVLVLFQLPFETVLNASVELDALMVIVSVQSPMKESLSTAKPGAHLSLQ